MKEVDAAKIQAEVQASLAKVDMQKMKTQLEKIKDVDFKKMEEELKNIKPEIEKSLANARIEMENAKKELTAYKDFINDLEKDGLIDKNNYTIEYKKGELLINGKKQPDNVVKKYSAFLKDRKDFNIKKNSDEFNIDKD